MNFINKITYIHFSTLAIIVVHHRFQVSNPFTDILYLNLGEHEWVGTYKLYAADGRLVDTGYFDSARQVAIPTESLPRGVYVLDVDLEGGLKGDDRRYKVLKQ